MLKLCVRVFEREKNSGQVLRSASLWVSCLFWTCICVGVEVKYAQICVRVMHYMRLQDFIRNYGVTKKYVLLMELLSRRLLVAR